MPKPRQVRLGAVRTCTLTPLASSAPRQRSSSTSTLQGEQTDRVTGGARGNTAGRGPPRLGTHPARPAAGGAGSRPRPMLQAACGDGGEDAARLRAAAPAGSAPPEEEEGPPPSLRAGSPLLRGRGPPPLTSAVQPLHRLLVPRYHGELRVPRLGGAAGRTAGSVTARFPPLPLRAPTAFRSPRRCARARACPGGKFAPFFAEASHLSRAELSGAKRDGTEAGEPPRSPAPRRPPLLRCDPALPTAPPALTHRGASAGENSPGSSGYAPGGGAGRGEAGARPSSRQNPGAQREGRVAAGIPQPARSGAAVRPAPYITRPRPPPPATRPPTVRMNTVVVVPGGLEPGEAGECGRGAGGGVGAAGGSRLGRAALPRRAMPASQGQPRSS